MSSLLWLVADTLNSPIVVGVVFSVLLQELFRYLIYLLLRKAEVGLKKLTESDTAIITNKNILAYGIYNRIRCQSSTDVNYFHSFRLGLWYHQWHLLSSQCSR